MHDPHRVLGVSPSATATDIRRAFRKLVLEVHPDRAGASSNARLLQVLEAYEFLTGKVRPRPRRDTTPAPARPTRGVHGRPYTASSGGSTRDRFNCRLCHDTFTVDGECPRCEVELTDGFPSAATVSPEVEAYIATLEARQPTPAWHGEFERRLPVATIGTLLTSGALALTISAPIASMMIGYGLVLLCADAVLGRSPTEAA